MLQRLSPPGALTLRFLLTIFSFFIWPLNPLQFHDSMVYSRALTFSFKEAFQYHLLSDLIYKCDHFWCTILLHWSLCYLCNIITLITNCIFPVYSDVIWQRPPSFPQFCQVSSLSSSRWILESSMSNHTNNFARILLCTESNWKHSFRKNPHFYYKDSCPETQYAIYV